jgi:hypothetical protein
MANQTNNADRELDLSDMSEKIKGAISRANDKMFDVILFIKRNIIIIVLLFIAGVALGIYLDKNKTYTQKLFVVPNFGSVDYLYAKVDNLNAKLREDEEVFLQGIGLKTKIGKVEIEPVVEIYKFIEGEENRNYDMFKLMSENRDVSDVVEDNVTARNFKRHVITFTTKGTVTEKDAVEPIMKYLNNSPYYKVIQKEGIEHLQRVIATNDSTLKQIDAILNDFSRSKTAGANSNLMYYNDNTNLNEIIKLKNKLIKEQGENKIDLLNSDKIIKDSEVVLNEKATKGIAGKFKLILPLLFLFIFVVINRFRAYYRSQMKKRQLA